MYVVTDVWHFAYRPLVAWLAFFAHSVAVHVMDVRTSLSVFPSNRRRGCG